MAEKKEPVLVVLQLSGGNDYLNTVIPYANSLYWDNRPAVNVPEDQIIPIDQALGFHPSMEALKSFYDAGNMAVMHGVGYADSPRSHFRSMDIWHTCEPDTVGTEGWLGRALARHRPQQGNRRHRRQLRPQHVPRHGASRRPRGLRQRRPGDLRHAAGHRRPAAPEGARTLQERLRPGHRPGRGDGLHGPDGPRFHGRRGRSQGGAAALPVERRVPRFQGGPQAARRRAGAYRRPGHPCFLSGPRQLRHPRQPARRARQTVARGVGRRQRLLHRPARARCGGQRRDADLHGIRAPGARQRLRHRPRRRWGGLPPLATPSRAACTATTRR